MAEYIAPLDLKNIFLNIFAGSQEVFMGLFFIGISVLAGLFKMPNSVFLMMVGLAGIILYNWFGGGLYIIIILITGIIVFSAISNIVKR